MSLRPYLPLLIRIPVIDFEGHPNPLCSFLNLNPSAKALFSNKVMFTSTGLELQLTFLGNKMQPITEINKNLLGTKYENI